MGRVESLLERDGTRCIWCGREPWPGERTAEHVCPKSKGGIGTDENLALACARCNRERRSKSASAFALAKAERGERPRLERIERIVTGLAASARRAHREYGEREQRHLGAVIARVGPAK